MCYTRPYMKNPWVIIGIITVVLFGGAILLSNQSVEQSNDGVEIIEHVKGNPEATVTLVEYSDFQCPACAAFQPVVEQLLTEYGDQLRFEYKHFPLFNIHPNAREAAVAAEAAGQQGKFYEYHDALFVNQAEWSAAAIPGTLFIKYATDLGLNVDQFKRQLKSSILRDKVLAEFNEGRELEITGTPTFFLNGQKMQFDTYESFITQIVSAIDPSLMGSSTSSTAEGVRFGL